MARLMRQRAAIVRDRLRGITAVSCQLAQIEMRAGVPRRERQNALEGLGRSRAMTERHQGDAKTEMGGDGVATQPDRVAKTLGSALRIIARKQRVALLDPRIRGHVRWRDDFRGYRSISSIL